MLAKILSIASPISVYVTLATLVWALIKERQRWEWFALAPAAVALAASLILAPAGHQLYFDEDIYIHIASNLAKAPVSQVTLLGSPEKIEASAYYKEPSGFPVLLSFVFMFTGPNEKAAFVFSHLIYAAAVAAVYLLGRTIFTGRKRAVGAALIFGAMPMCLGFSNAASTDLPAALFAVIGMLGVYAKNGPLAAAALAMAAQTRLEAIVLLPILLVSQGFDRKWKALALGLTSVECLHILWVLSITPALAQAENADSAFSLGYLVGNIMGTLKYMLTPWLYPTLIAVSAIAIALRKKDWQWKPTVAWGLLAMSIYPIVKDGSFQRNPRYSIHASAPIALLAASSLSGYLGYGLAATMILPYLQLREANGFREDHEVAVSLATQLGPEDLVVTAEPEIFLNQGISAMNALYASERKEKLIAQFRGYERLIYYAGIRTSLEHGKEWEVDQWLKSAFEMRRIDSVQITGGQVVWFELLNPRDRQVR